MKFKVIVKKIRHYLIIAFIYCGLIHRTSANAFFNTLFNLLRFMSNSLIDVNMMALPLVWMDKSKSHKKDLLRHSSKGISYGPHYIGRMQSTENIFLPNIHYYIFKRARISVTSSSVILNDKQAIIDRAIGTDQTKYNFSSGHIIAHSRDTAVVRLNKAEYIKKGIFLGGNGSSNYYHWIVEILTKLEFLSMLPEHYRKYPLLVSEDVIRIPSFRYTLDLFAKGYETIVTSKKLPYVVDELIYINSPNNLPFNLFGNQKFKCSYVTINRLSIDYLRKSVLQDAFKTPALPNYPKKIFLCRKSVLRNYNQDEVFTILSMFGFTKIFMEDLHFLEQVRTIYHADFIVGPTGAAWTNLIFCRSGAKGLCWMADESADFSAYSTIASIVGVDLRYLTYKAGVHSTTDLYYKDYYIDPSMIKKGLSAALGETIVRR